MRKVTWVILIFNVAMLAWFVYAANVETPVNCTGVAPADLAECENDTIEGAGVGTLLIFGLWLVGDVVLALWWIVTRRRREGEPRLDP